jgi:hypothetical protein
MRSIITFVLTFFLVTLCSWGFLVHRTVNQLAVYQLPGELRIFFYKNLDYLVKNAPRPDQRRNEDSTEATKHFIDIEIFGDSAAWKMPMNWDDAVKKYGRDSLLKYGYLPYHIITMENRLTNAFRSGNADSVLFYAADLGHYIGDAHVPLHTSVNYDGQLTNQKGLHSLWESFIPELEIDQYKLYNHHKAIYLDDPTAAIWKAIRHSFSLAKDVFDLERQASKNFTDSTKYRVQIRNGRESKSYTTEFAKAYSELLKPTINDQLLHSSNLIADFWYTAWVNAGKPDLSFKKKDKKAMKKELKVYKKDELIQKGLLIARQKQAGQTSN